MHHRQEKRNEMAQQNDVLIPGLPNEMAICCLAWVPRTDHRNMSSVCRSWWKLLHGNVLYEVRRRLSAAEEYLYLWTKSGNVWRCYDPSSSDWLRLPQMPDDNRVAGHSAFASFDGKLFVIGGCVLDIYKSDDVYIACKTVSYFDVRSSQWKRAADLNIARAKCMIGIIDNQLYVFGGYTEEPVSTDTAEAYDPITDTWRLISSMGYPVALRDGVVMGRKFYTVCRLEGMMWGFVYDAQTDAWEDMPSGLSRGWGVMTTVLNGKLYTLADEFVGGNLGHGIAPKLEKLVQIYDPSTDGWETVNEVTDEFWDQWALMLVLGEVQLVSCGRNFYIISVQDLELEEIDSDDDETMVHTIIAKVKDFTEIQSCSARYGHDFSTEVLNEPGPLSLKIKRCQIVSL